MRWFVLVATVVLSLAGLYFSLFNIWLTGTPVPDPDGQAKHAGVVVATTGLIFVAGLATFTWLTFRKRRGRGGRDKPDAP